jgi:hypothetical protein
VRSARDIVGGEECLGHQADSPTGRDAIGTTHPVGDEGLAAEAEAHAASCVIVDEPDEHG